MKCPNCQSKKFDVYEAPGFTSVSSPINECECGYVWRVKPLGYNMHNIDIIKQTDHNAVYDYNHL